MPPSVSEAIQSYLPPMPSVPITPRRLTDTMTSLLGLLWRPPATFVAKYVPALPASVSGLWPLLLSPTSYLFRPSPDAVRRHLYLGPPGCTFGNEDALPPLPVPGLAVTLRAYLESCRPHLAGEGELRELEAALAEFEMGIGAELQAKLEERAANSRNWLEQWWEEHAYLKQRSPLVPFNTMVSVEPRPTAPAEDFDFSFATLRIHFLLEFWSLLRQERIKPQVMVRKDPATGESVTTPFTMHQFRRFFHTARIPSQGMDTLVSHFTTERETGADCPNHFVVMYRGHVYSMQVADWHPGGGCEVMTPPELERAFRWILADVRGRTPTFGPGVPALTNDDRDAWADNRRRLVELDPGNAELLRLVDSSLVSWSLRDTAPRDESELLGMLMMGEGIRDWWSDRSFSYVAFRNGARGSGSDHSPMDGMVNAIINHFVNLSIESLGGEWPSNRQSSKAWPDPKRIDFVIDEKLEDDVRRISTETHQRYLLANAKCGHFHDFGKGLLKIYKTHPDAFVQTALQLAYFKLHGRPGSAYETAAIRKFYRGRTETCRTCTTEAVEFAKAMLDPSTESAEIWRLLKAALNKHQQLMNTAQNDLGCDRHLFGLQIVARECGKLEDPAFQKVFGSEIWKKSGGNGNFTLSTSLLGYTFLLGGMVPMCQDGYGFFYTIEDYAINYTFSNWKGSETDSEAMEEALHESLREMERLAAEHAKK